MPIRRIYTMSALPGQGDALAVALRNLAETLSGLAGNQGVELLADGDDTQTYIFIERWANVESQKAAGARLGKAAFADIGPRLSAPPVSVGATLLQEWSAGVGQT